MLPQSTYKAKAGYMFMKTIIFEAVVSSKIGGTVPKQMSVQLANEFGEKLAIFHRAVTELPHANGRSLMNPQLSGVRSTILFSRFAERHHSW